MYKLPRDLGISGVKLGVCVNADNNIIGPDLFIRAKVTSEENEEIYLYSEWTQVRNHNSGRSRISQEVGGGGTANPGGKGQKILPNIPQKLHENERNWGEMREKGTSL